MFLLGTSWKMNKTRAEARAWIEQVHASGIVDAGMRTTLDVFVVPPFTAIGAAVDTVRALDAAIAVGAQNVHEATGGAFTGEISASMLTDLGCEFVELGHSERRRLFAESDERVALKVRAALDHGLRPLICIGDTREERDAGAALDSVRRQARIALSRCSADECRHCRLAYEPVWAIGVAGEAAAPADVAAVHAALRECYPGTALLYGGSVDAGNAAALARLDGVDGLFVGRAALDPGGFVAIARAVAGLADSGSGR